MKMTMDDETIDDMIEKAGYIEEGRSGKNRTERKDAN